MSFPLLFIPPSIAAVVNSGEFVGAFVKLSSDDTRDWRPNIAIPWTGTDDVDVGAWHDPSVNNTRLTVPAGYNIERVRILVNVYVSSLAINSNCSISVRKNGSATFDNFPINTYMGLTSGYTTLEWHMATETMPATAGDYFEIYLDMGEGDASGHTLLAANTYAMIEATHFTGDTYKGCNITQSTDLTAVNATAGYIVPWDAELSDPDNWHDNVTNNTRITIPAGVTRIRITSYLRLALIGGTYVYVLWRKNGSGTYEGSVDKAWKADGSLTSGDWQLTSGDIPVTPGDYFELAFFTDDASVTILSTSRAVFEAVEYDQDLYALATASANQTGNFTGGQLLTFNTNTRNVGSWWSPYAPTRFTVPADSQVSHVDLTAYLRHTDIQNVSNNQFGYVAFRKNGSDTYVGKTAYAQAKGATTWEMLLNAFSVPCQPGDYFEVLFISGAQLGADSNVTVQASRTFQIRATHFEATAGTSNFFALDSLSVTAAAAFSTRKLRGGYSGSALRVRRSSDSTEQDIGFTAAGELDTTALLAFCGAGDGFVRTWYDQSGNGRDFGNATTTQQPKIVSSGAVVTNINSTPCLDFDGSDDFLQGNATWATIIPSFSSAHTTMAMIRAETASAPGSGWQGQSVYGDSGGYWWCNSHSGSWRIGHYFTTSQETFVANAGVPDTAIIGTRFGSSSQRSYANGGGSEVAKSGPNASMGTGSSYIGRSQSAYWNGQIGELIFFNSRLSLADLNLHGGNMATRAGETWTTMT